MSVKKGSRVNLLSDVGGVGGGGVNIGESRRPAPGVAFKSSGKFSGP